MMLLEKVPNCRGRRDGSAEAENCWIGCSLPMVICRGPVDGEEMEKAVGRWRVQGCGGKPSWDQIPTEGGGAVDALKSDEAESDNGRI